MTCFTECMTPRHEHRPPTKEEQAWGIFAMLLFALYLLVVVVRPLYDLMMGY